MSISTHRSMHSLAPPYKKHSILPSPICPRCQEVLDVWYSDVIIDSNTYTIADPQPSAPRVVESCFLCSKFLGLYRVTLTDQAKYLEALRLDPQHGLVSVSQKWRFYERFWHHQISMYHCDSHLPPRERIDRSEWGGSDLERQSLWTYSQEDLAGSESYLLVASSTGSDESLNLSKQWLENCNKSHIACSLKATTHMHFLPTRLIDIGSEESAIPPRLCLREEIPSNSAYFTLSHCWGNIMPEITLLQSTIEFMLREINFSQLSNTFQDALRVVRKLGGRYIWIDSLCIIQDSETDWLVESASMCDVYSNSHCNICATAARDGSESMFRDREPLQIQQGWFQTTSNKYNRCVIDPYTWIKEVENGILSSRAWVCQERLLSRRNLHFGSRQLFWECLDHEASETFPKGIPRLVFDRSIAKSEVRVLVNGIDKCQSDLSLDGGQIWENIVKLFMKSNLTFKTDRLVAIEGMANAASQKIGGRYLAGVWEKHLLSGILWNAKHYPSNVSKFTLAPIKTQEFIAPSWSWASSDAEIGFLPSRGQGTGGIEKFLQILETHVDLAIDNPFGKVCGGYIKLKGDIASATCYHPNISGSGHPGKDFGIFFGRGGKKLESLSPAIACCDFVDMTEIDRQEVYLLPVCRIPLLHDNWEARALILFPTNRARWEFRRCGVFIYVTDEAHEHVMSECRFFSSEQKIESSEFGLQDDGKFIIKIF